MSDTKKMPADGGGIHKGKPDGVSGTPAAGKEGEVQGRFTGGESAGGAYPNRHDGEGPKASGFLGHGGQTENAYYGGDNPNATTGGGVLPEEGSDSEHAPAPVREPHVMKAGQQTFEVVEDSGVAAAEATGKVATDRPYEREQESPGGG